MFGKDDDKKPGGVESLIGPSVKVDGKFFGKGTIVVQGQVAGTMKTNENLQIDQGAIVKASIEAKNITVAGEVQGNVKAYERLELAESARVTGDVEAKTISIGAGAVLNGKCTMAATTATMDREGEQTQPQNKQKNSRRAELPI
ncbi:MAG: polymer-forming cytoskeletal protein [bacterium]